jgi:hypothetical protein
LFFPEPVQTTGTTAGTAVRLYDRTGGGIIAQAVDLPLAILDADL